MFEREAATRRIVEKARTDEAFRNDLKSNPHQALEKELGVKLGPDYKVTILEETPKNFYLVLPLNPSPELSESDLASVAGGHNDNDTWGCGG